MLIPRNITIDVFHHHDLGGGVIAKLDAVLAAIEELPPKLNQGFLAMTEASDRLAREVAETRQSVLDLTGRYQTKIDAMQVEINHLNEALANGDTAGAQAASDALDALQTEMSQLGASPPAEEPPPAEPPVGEDTQTA